MGVGTARQPDKPEVAAQIVNYVLVDFRSGSWISLDKGGTYRVAQDVDYLDAESVWESVLHEDIGDSAALPLLAGRQ